MINIASTNIKSPKGTLWCLVFFAMSIFTQCEVEDPVKEDTPELITRATLTFTPETGDAIVVTATDPDGEGVKDISTDKPIELNAGVRYSLDIQLVNELVDPTSPDYDIGAEVEEQGGEHLFFFGWTGNVFDEPDGDGNIDDREDPVNYQDHDVNALPVGIHTTWTAGAASSGTFRLLLKHQPGLKSASSGSTEGETDLDVVFDIIVR